MPLAPSRLRWAALPCAAAFAACSGSFGTDPYFGATRPRDDGQTLAFGNGAEPESIDPGLVYDSSGNEIVQNLFEGLLRRDPVTARPVPGLAERYDVSEDLRTYTFHLREAYWSDGHPITASDFVFAWRRVLAPATAAQYATQLWMIRGGKAFNSGELKDPEQLGVRAVDARTLEVVLEHPTPYFLELTSYSPLYPVPRWALEAHGDQWTRPEHLVSSGPFRLAAWLPQYQLELVRNPTYWDAASVRLERAVALSSDDNHALMRFYRSGVVDFSGSNGEVPQEYREALREKRDYQNAPYFGSYYYDFNVTQPALRDVRVRRALTLAVDKESLVKFVTKGGQRASGNLVPPYLKEATGYAPPPGESYDPARARTLLAEAGYPGGRGFPGLTISYNTSEGHRSIAEAIQQMWKKELGIEVKLENQEWKVFLKNKRDGYYEVARDGWIGDYMDPHTFLSLLICGSDQNYPRWCDPAFDAALERAASAPDPASRNAAYQAAEQRVLDELPILPLYVYTRTSLLAPYVRGIHSNLQDHHPLRAVWIDRDGDPVARAARAAAAEAGARTGAPPDGGTR